MYQDKLPPVSVLPGGRRVRDYDHLTVEAQAEAKAAEEKKKKKAAEDWVSDHGFTSEEEEKPKKKPAKKAEDESLG